MNFTKYLEQFNFQEMYTFLGIGLFLICIYFIIRKIISTARMSNDYKRQFTGYIRTVLFFIFFGSFFILWADELYEFIISIAAMLAALAIAGKEIFLCFGGSLYKAFARPFSIGDRIEIDGIRGDVVDIGLMSTQMMEVGPKDYTQQLTGRTITIPNSRFLTAEICNETDSAREGRDFVLHVFKVPIKHTAEWEQKKNKLLDCAKEACDKYHDQALTFYKYLSKERQIDMPFVEPRINVKFDTSEQIFLIVRVSIPIERRGTIEQEIITSYLTKTFE